MTNDRRYASGTRGIRQDKVADLVKEELRNLAQALERLDHSASLGVSELLENPKLAENLTRRGTTRTAAQQDNLLRREQSSKMRLQVARAKAQREYITAGLANGLLLSSREVAEMLGSFDDNPRQFLNPKRNALELIAVRHRNANFYPTFQFVADEKGIYRPLPELPQILAPLKESGYNEWDMIFWLEAPAWALEGRCVSDILTEPGGPERAIQMAEALRKADTI